MRKATPSLLLAALLVVACAPTATAPLAEPVPVETGIDPEGWVRVPAGKFLMGQHDHEVVIDHDYEVMITPVTNGQYARYLNAALAAGKVRVMEGEVAGYYAGDTFQGYRHEEKIEAGERLHVPLSDPGLRLSFDGKAFAPRAGYENHPTGR